MRNEDLLHAYNTAKSAMETLQRAMEVFKKVMPTPIVFSLKGDDVINNERKAMVAKAFMEDYERICLRYGLMIDGEEQFVTSNGQWETVNSDGTILKEHIAELRKSINLNNIILKFKEE